MAAVFLPVAFTGGSTGVFYKQFGITLSIAILISAIHALTLCPALAAMLLKPPKHINPVENESNKIQKYRHRFGMAFNASYDSLLNKYKKVILFLAPRKWIVLITILVFSGGLYYMAKYTPFQFCSE